MPPKSRSRAGSQVADVATASAANGKTDWEQIVSQLGQATELSFDSSAANRRPAFDAKEFTEQQAAESGRNQFADKISNSSDIQAFLQQKLEEFEREILGTNDSNVAFPLYVPRVNMVEATHVMPAEPTATDAFRFHQMPEKIADLPYSGPNWVSICNNAIEAASFKFKMRQHEQQKQQQQQQPDASSAHQQQQQQQQRRLTKLAEPGRVADFIPIILVPGGASAVVQIANVKALLEDGLYTAPYQHWMDNQTGETTLARRDESQVFVSPHKILADEPSVKFRQFRVVDDPALVDNWDHVCGCFVSGLPWQFDGWYGGNAEKSQPRNLFGVTVKGFMPYFDDEKAPSILNEWNVVALQLSRRGSKAHASIRAARIFWESLFEFMEAHPYFRQFTLAPPTISSSAVSNRR